MKKLFILTIILVSSSYNVYAEDKKKFKLNTESKLTDILTGKKEFKLPNPLNGLKKIGKALKPSALEK